MVRKLWKYEMRAFMRRFLPLELFVLLAAVLNRILQIFENDGTAYSIVFGSSVALLCVAVAASLFGVIVISIARFYKNMFSNEGYLTLSLPVTPAQHILTKLFVTYVCLLIAFVTALCAVGIATSGDMLNEICKAVGYLGAKAWSFHKGELIAFCLEAFLALSTMELKFFCLFYACLSIGQRAKKNRIGMSVLCYFIYYIVMQAVSTINVVVISVISDMDWFYNLLEYVRDHPRFCFHIGIVIFIIWQVLFAVIWYAVSHHIIRKKLNLE